VDIRHQRDAVAVSGAWQLRQRDLDPLELRRAHRGPDAGRDHAYRDEAGRNRDRTGDEQPPGVDVVRLGWCVVAPTPAVFAF